MQSQLNWVITQVEIRFVSKNLFFVSKKPYSYNSLRKFKKCQKKKERHTKDWEIQGGKIIEKRNNVKTKQKTKVMLVVSKVTQKMRIFTSWAYGQSNFPIRPGDRTAIFVIM